jgi:SAM-dependent methyltransferase
MGTERSIVTALHVRTKRDYLPRMVDDKVSCMRVAREYGPAFWDGDRRFGYGGYSYDGRWAVAAARLIEAYGLRDGAKILDVGCGKGFLLYELKRLLPHAEVVGFDISEYAIANAKEEIRSSVFVHRAQDPFPFDGQTFDLALSITTLHNLRLPELKVALTEMERTARERFLVVESYRDENEQFNLQCWALTCESFFYPDEWIWLFNEFGYTGDYEFIYFQ